MITYCFCFFSCIHIWNAISAISALGLLFLTYYIVRYAKHQLQTLNETSNNSLKVAKADFTLRFEDNFFTKKTRELFFLVENNLLIYKKVVDKLADFDFHYFELNNDKLEKYPILKKLPFIKDLSVISSNEIDDLLLGHFEDLGIYLENDMLSLNFIYESFEYYVRNVWENDQIQTYIKAIRASKKEDSDTYDKFESIYNSVIAYGKEKMKIQPLTSMQPSNAGHTG
jgi:hypothetical protein